MRTGRDGAHVDMRSGIWPRRFQGTDIDRHHDPAPSARRFSYHPRPRVIATPIGLVSHSSFSITLAWRLSICSCHTRRRAETEAQEPTHGPWPARVSALSIRGPFRPHCAACNEGMEMRLADAFGVADADLAYGIITAGDLYLDVRTRAESRKGKGILSYTRTSEERTLRTLRESHDRAQPRRGLSCLHLSAFAVVAGCDMWP